ncbi:carboxypeptidase M32 [Planomicrobium sp. YIM 101495]|uniref:carboxypeptidase M32 n=1 Tax=Planomicrobium sp. YIM 101495 TaxID=2665160 RepID=UPI0012B7B54F|nr:carboxypeptidase M32 [Planomicrobium sp. YIM 101495]MTD30733.1 carboxypeptidase M32 [Planomicrobium sp. YIM 101495]
MVIQKEKDAFLALLKEQSVLKNITFMMQWDTHANIPPKGLDDRLESVGYISEKLHQLNTSDKMKYYIDLFKEDPDDELLRQIALECEALYDKNRKIPQQLHKEFVMLKAKSEAVWQEARKQSDFQLFQPYLEKMVAYNQQFTDYWGYDAHRYDALLNQYEPGMTVELLDGVFPKLRTAIIDLLGRINGSDKEINESKLTKYFPEANQKELSLALLSKIGFDGQAGRLDTSVHPYTFAFHKNDVRITTRYNPNDFRESVSSALHEGGHALYEQNFADKLRNTPLAEVSSMGMHESQALYWESFIHGSKEFWEANLDVFKTHAPKEFHDLTASDLYQSSHVVKPSLIRVEADEVTYPLHIMIRYELEKALLDGEVKMSDLPGIWNEKMKDYLGVAPPSDREGILQDIHWSSGDFGYFPLYTIGMMYAAQLHHTMDKELHVKQRVRNNELEQIKGWLTDHVYQYGKSKKPLDILMNATNEPLNPDYLITYLTGKYSDLYEV